MLGLTRVMNVCREAVIGNLKGRSFSDFSRAVRAFQKKLGARIREPTTLASISHKAFCELGYLPSPKISELFESENG